MGRAEWYRGGTHWEKHVHGGSHSTLVLWPPKQGIRWQQTWPKAVRVRPGETYRGSVWGEAVAANGASYLALEFSDTDYQPLLTVKSDALASDAGWQQLSLVATVPDRRNGSGSFSMVKVAEEPSGTTMLKSSSCLREGLQK